jgi:N6-L-threonylcarbamoyladenine synthase
MSTILALETSCDETAVAIMRGHELLASEIASQSAVHQAYGGVVPEVASRNHLVHAPRLLASAIATAGISLPDVDAFAATSGPGLASSLMIGASIAKGLALASGKPYLAINHLEGHLLSPFFGKEVVPNVSLVVSGGHTMLVHVASVGVYTLLGRTADDAAGEAFDKVAKLLGLGYPGGPEIERRAEQGNPHAFTLPRSMLHSGDHNFSFSGLKTAVRYLLPKIEGDRVADVCASFQQAVVDVLVRKTVAAAKQTRCKVVTVSGGVSCNRALRAALARECDEQHFTLRTAPPQLCTDNAAMIAFVASMRLAAGQISDVRDEIDPNLALVSTRVG